MKKVISALIVVIVVAIGAVYFASNEVEKNYQRIVNDLNNIKGFKISNNNYKKGFFGSKGSFDFSVSKDLLENIFGKNVNEDLVFKVENEISHTVLAFIDGFEIDSKISIQNDMIKNIIATFMGSNVIATTKTKVSLTGDKDVDIKFSNIEFNDKQKTAVNTKDIKIGMTLDSKDSINSLKVEADKIALKDFSEYNKVDLNIEGFYIDSSYKEPVKISKILESQLVPYLAKVKFKRVSFASNDVSSILIDDFEYDSKFEISNDLGRSDDVIKIGIVAVDKVKYTDFVFDSKIANINVPALNNVLDKLNNLNNEENYNILAGLNFDEIIDQILEKNPSIKIDTLSFKKGYKALKLNLDAAVNGFKKGTNQSEIFDKLSLSGKISVDESLANFFDTLVPEVAFVEPTLISAGYFKEEDKKVISEFKYDPNKKDIIFNGKVGLQNFFMGF